MKIITNNQSNLNEKEREKLVAKLNDKIIGLTNQELYKIKTKKH